ncbi:MAG: VCBS repeat-containing protein [Flavobacteriaceae bacterium]|nr:VCBS repeat-containing protein [Flavobacteriaceae bacterium]
MKNRKFLRSTTKIGFAVLLTFLLFGCNNETRQFTLISPTESGIDFQNTITENDDLNILDYLYFYNGGGVAMGDINNDGLPDLYFSSNQGPNKLYLNQGDFKFKDITTSSGTLSKSSWNTASIMADFNADGWLDIYVVSVVGINDFEGHNELFINNQDNTFTEKSAEFGLDLQTYGTTAAVFDYDLDGDLDLYLLNHAVHTEESFGKAQLREIRNEKTGDRLMRNDGNRFVDVSEEAGIYGGINGYGLGLAISDFNKDGFPDIYVGNDFHEDDYYYLNNSDGTFSESLKDFFGHTSRFSMGNDAADINNDGWPDLISLDMSPEDETVLKSSEGDDTYQTLKMRTEQYGYHFQFTRNMLYLNNKGKPYAETAILSGISATDWSWSALFGDYDLDGNQDLFVSNGIPKRPNDLDFIRFVSSEEIRTKINDTRLVDQTALEMMPSGIVSNYIYQGDGTGSFNDVSTDWISTQPTVSGATAIGDLDNDGDLDIVTNNINDFAGIYRNNSASGNFLKLKLNYSQYNPFGIGTKAYVYTDSNSQFRELFPCKGWQASSEPMLHFGLAMNSKVDSIKIVWPNNTYQVVLNPEINQTLTISEENTMPFRLEHKNIEPIFKKVEGNLGITYTHREDNHTDFNYQKLIPFEVSQRGPALAIGDINRDGLDDLFFGGARNQPNEVYLQTNDRYVKTHYPELARDSVSEDIDAQYLGFDDGRQFVIPVTTGGNNISNSVNALKDRIIHEGVDSLIVETNDYQPLNGGKIVVMEQDHNPGTSIFFGNHTTPLDFGNIPDSYFVGEYKMSKGSEKIGMVTDAIAEDFDNDGQTDLIIVGEWMSPKFFRNNNGTFEEVSILNESLNGLWQKIIPFDIDQDGDNDYLLGNWGLNSKFKATKEAPMKMYYSDFDGNGTNETVVAIEKNGKYYPLLGLNELSEQLVFLRKKFNNYKDFAGKTVEEIFGIELLQTATVFEVNTLSSGFLRNNGNSFKFEAFPSTMQIAPIRAFEKYDFDGDGIKSVLAGGNYFGVIPFHGRFDSFSGALINSENEIIPGNQLGLEMEHKSARHLKVINLNNQSHLLIVYNNDDAQIYEIVQK